MAAEPGVWCGICTRVILALWHGEINTFSEPVLINSALTSCVELAVTITQEYF